MQRATWRSEELAAKYKLTDWCVLQRKRKQQRCELCSRTAGQPVFLNGHHGFAQIQREVRVVPKSDGAIHRICKFLCKHLFIFKFLPVPFVIGRHA